eukprot:5209839-Prymnesium_polylepis.1
MFASQLTCSDASALLFSARMASSSSSTPAPRQQRRTSTTRGSDVPTARTMQRQVKRQPDFTLALSDVISMPALPAYSHDAKQLGTIKMILNVPRPGGSAGTLVLLPAVLSFVCGCSKDR